MAESIARSKILNTKTAKLGYYTCTIFFTLNTFICAKKETEYKKENSRNKNENRSYQILKLNYPRVSTLGTYMEKCKNKKTRGRMDSSSILCQYWENKPRNKHWKTFLPANQPLHQNYYPLLIISSRLSFPFLSLPPGTFIFNITCESL